MSPTTTFWVVLILVSLALTCVAAIAAKSLREFSRQKLAAICHRRKKAKLLREILLRHDDVALGAETLQVVATAVLVCASAYWVWSPAEGDQSAPPGWATIVSAIVLGGLLLLAVEVWLPQAIAKLWAEPFIYFTWRGWRFVSVGISPLVWAARFVNTFLHRLAGRIEEASTEESFEDEIRTIVSEGHREGLLEEDAREMIEGVIDLGDADVSEVMTPRTDMVSMPLPESLDEAVRFVIGVSHTRIPVHGATRDDIIGVLHARDLLPELAKPDRKDRLPVKKILREPYFVPETKRVDDLLEEFQRTHNHMAIVLDEYGGVSGLVTIEDVLEEIVGEIVDEYDDAVIEEIKRIDEHTAEALARVHVDEINERFGLSLPDDGEFDTIGGFVFHQLGRIPKVGEHVTWENVRLTVLAATRRRIERVRIELPDPAQRESA